MEWFFVAKCKVTLFLLRLFQMEELYEKLKTASDEFVQADKDYDASVAVAAEKTGLRQQAEQAEQEAKERAQQERIAAENRAKHEAEVAARREALKPDLEKVRTWATAITSVQIPSLASAEIAEQVRRADLDIARRLDVLMEQITEGP